MNQYKEAVDYLTGEKVGGKKYKEAFFGLLDSSHKEKLKAIFDNCAEKPVAPESKLKAAFEEIKHHVTWKKTQHALSIALLAISIVGVLCLVFSPTPAGVVLFPLGWGLIGGAAIAGLGVMAGSFYESYALNKNLEKLKASSQINSNS
jgi:hypothetical protein